MGQRKTHVVDLDAMKVRDTLIGDGIEYEINATSDEVKHIEILFSELKQDTSESLKYLLLPFNEKKVDQERHAYDEHLLAIFRMLYNLGTQKTKEDIDSLGLFK